MRSYYDQDADLKGVQNGEFAREWILENQANRPDFNGRRRIEAEYPMEEVGKKLRSLMIRLKK
jgi:ketol-acid reductoisomerase